jgi:teichuronic acid biosynthesis glycosyltransferase TuaG
MKLDNYKENNIVDIIMPVYNCENYIYKTINSILNQSYKNWRLLVINDCSTDNTKKILNKIYKRNKKKKILIFHNKKNFGQAYSRNICLKKATSKFIAFIDSDDIWKKDKLKDQVQFMKNNNYNFTYTNYQILNKKVKKIINVPSLYNYNKFIYNTSIATSTIVINNKFFKNIKFDNLRLCEDYAYKCKLLKKNGLAYKLNKANTIYRLRNDSLQSNRLKVLYYVWLINKKINKINFFRNLMSLLMISLNSIKKYGLR